MSAAKSDQLTMREARTRYFEANDFGPEGGYNDEWVKVELGPIPLRFPNTPARVRAVRYHDLHHVLTGYATNMRGESEISAWELASGCRDFWAAWVLNAGALAYGLLACPRRVWAAFCRGRRSRNLYDRDFDDALLERRVGPLRAELGLDPDIAVSPAQATVADRLAFFAAALVSLGLPLALIAALLHAIARAFG